MDTNINVGESLKKEIQEIANSYLNKPLRGHTHRALEADVNNALENFKWRGLLPDDYRLYVEREPKGRLRITDVQ